MEEGNKIERGKKKQLVKETEYRMEGRKKE
jgi:hypothetical protein